MRRTAAGHSKPVPSNGEVVAEVAFGLFVVKLPATGRYMVIERFNKAQYYADQRSAVHGSATYAEGRAA